MTEVGIFGSYARGEQTQTSDVDVLIDYEQAPIANSILEIASIKTKSAVAD